MTLSVLRSLSHCAGSVQSWWSVPDTDSHTVLKSANHINSFMNFRVADIQACYELWKSRGAEFITEPIPKYGEIRCYIRDPDGYIIEVGQSTDLTYG